MAENLFMAGICVGAVFGLLHAAYVFRVICADGTADGLGTVGRALYYAIWTFVLWTLLGTYVLVLWIVGLILWLPFKAVRV